MLCEVADFQITLTPLVTRSQPAKQRLHIACRASRDAHLFLTAVRDGRTIADRLPLPVRAGANETAILLPVPEREVQARFTLTDDDGSVIAESRFPWQPPRPWTIYVIRASHTDIGLHNSQYIQRFNCSRYLEKAMELCDRTAEWEDAARYRYVVEGIWFWGNYCADQGTEAARRVVEKYVKTGRIAIGAATAGNHTQVYGHEQMCRSAYTREKLKADWHVDSRTMTMIDCNGLSWALVAPYVDAGFRNIVFAPNQWNPLPSTIWPRDARVTGGTWNPDASGGGTRIDVRYDSALPMVFYWQGADEKSRLLVWGSTHYEFGGSSFGIMPNRKGEPQDLADIADRTARQLLQLEKRYPFDLWMFASYGDDEEPNLNLNEVLRTWNRTWRWPEYRTVGDLDEPFDRLRERFDAQIPVLRGDITGGWYQHPLSTPELLAQKFAADRLLPTAEKLATLAGIFAPGYRYPAIEFARAWDALICNDEHSYGTSGYQGRRVYETWMQHRDWIEKAETVAERECDRAFTALSSQIAAGEPSVVLFNPSLQERRELVTAKNAAGETIRFLSSFLPAFGYAIVPEKEVPVATGPVLETPDSAPTVENEYYRLTFSDNGSLASIFDKELKRELLDPAAPFQGNQFVYTNDNHRSFTTPQKARFRIERDASGVTVIAEMDEPVSGAALVQRVTLPFHEKRIDIDNRLRHVRDLINKSRYYRYGYYAFPFRVENAGARVQLNGCIAVPGKDQTGHGTETYMAAREWCCVENAQFGVALFQLDSQLVEFGEIHPDKTDCYLKNRGSAVYSYLFNDWLQMHTPGGSHVHPRFRYTIYSYTGDFRRAGVPELGERLAHPAIARSIPAQEGILPSAGTSFIRADHSNLRLLALKRAEDGKGVVARFQETDGAEVDGVALHQSLVPDGAITRCTVDERRQAPEPAAGTYSLGKHGYLTLRVEGRNIPALHEDDPPSADGRPAPIGSAYTGLITTPRAACGERQGHLYLIWGQNSEPDLSHYELYRSEQSGFRPDEKTFVARVEPGVYRVALYEDTDLRTHTEYFYRVRAVNRSGMLGEFSEEFSGVTRE